jgi:hypothetical protein
MSRHIARERRHEHDVDARRDLSRFSHEIVPVHPGQDNVHQQQRNRPTVDSTWIRPPACLTIASTLASPVALPPASPVAKKGLEQRRLHGCGHPAPGSATTILTCSPRTPLTGSRPSCVCMVVVSVR